MCEIISVLSISHDGSEQAKKAADLLRQELYSRTGTKPELSADGEIHLLIDPSVAGTDDYIIEKNRAFIFRAKSLRGLVYAIGLFLRRTEYCGGEILLIEDISGKYSPCMSVRGHQLGYRTTPNAYDAWDLADYERYYLDLMYFGVNTVEHIPSEGNHRKNCLMRYETEELCAEASALADQWDLDVSLWYPNAEESMEEMLGNRKAVFEQTPRIDAVFPPGGDPGDFNADEFIHRVKAISVLLKQQHPKAKMFPSAQAPRQYPNWGNLFIHEMEKLPSEIDGVVLGPNRAMDLDELRMRLPGRYPIRLYPDITHNVRCEYPVHFDRNDWHFAWAIAESRECINPRPREYRRIHRLTRGYIIGSVSYSEGINDDLNKMIWSDMDYFGETDLRQSVSDYVRLFFPGSDVSLLTDAIFGLEENWNTDPAEGGCIEDTYRKWLSAGEKNPALLKNWRYILHLFRASCDLLVQKRRRFELKLVRESKKLLQKNLFDQSRQALQQPFDEDYTALREKIEEYAAFLFKAIGYQTDVKRYFCDSWERGATLETIDLPVTDRAYLLNRFAFADTLPTEERLPYIKEAATRTQVDQDEYYYSVAMHGLAETGTTQTGEVYLNFKGDNPSINDGSAPMSVLNVYDNFTFTCKVSGLTAETDYQIRIVYLNRRSDEAVRHTVLFNDEVLYQGPQFGAEDPDYDRLFLPKGFVSAVYTLPHRLLCNGCGILALQEDTMGVMFSEILITKKENLQ